MSCKVGILPKKPKKDGNQAEVKEKRFSQSKNQPPDMPGLRRRCVNQWTSPNLHFRHYQVCNQVAASWATMGICISWSLVSNAHNSPGPFLVRIGKWKSLLSSGPSLAAVIGCFSQLTPGRGLSWTTSPRHDRILEFLAKAANAAQNWLTVQLSKSW